MWVLGVIFAAAGVALAIMVMTQPGLMQVYGLTLEVAAIAIVGGALAAGLGGVINALDAVLAQPHDDHHHHHAPSAAVVGGAVAATAATAAAAVESVAEKATTEVKVAAETAKSTVSETVAALEKAKDDITVALGGDKKPEEPPPVKVEEVKESSEEEEGTDDDTLYVVEEKTIRGRPARILSDGTVEAETDEGWMRFENMEHLDEYLDATGEDKA
jgi:hypothetical protein